MGGRPCQRVDRGTLVQVVAVAALALLLAGVLAVLFLPRPPAVEGLLELEPVLEGLDQPVAFAFAPDGRLFYNELRQGRVRVVADGQVLETPFVTVEVAIQGEMGLLGLALDPDFAQEPYVYVYYTHAAEDGPFNRISRFRAEGNVAGPEEVLLDRIPAATRHNSGRLGFGPDGLLYASVGDATQAEEAQDPASLPGAIHRLHRNGTRPADNPIAGSTAYLFGIRNVFGFDWTPGGTLLFTENGPTGNDEVNRGVPGGNYGWPVVQGPANDTRFVRPLVTYTPAIAPTGLAFYAGDRLGANGSGRAYFGSWNHGTLHRLEGDAEAGTGSFAGPVVLDTGDAIFDVVDAPDGFLYLSTTTAIARVVVRPVDSPAASGGPVLLALAILAPSTHKS